jgi:hypothetical protein
VVILAYCVVSRIRDFSFVAYNILDISSEEKGINYLLRRYPTFKAKVKRAKDSQEADFVYYSFTERRESFT